MHDGIHLSYVLQVHTKSSQESKIDTYHSVIMPTSASFLTSRLLYTKLIPELSNTAGVVHGRVSYLYNIWIVKVSREMSG